MSEQRKELVYEKHRLPSRYWEYGWEEDEEEPEEYEQNYDCDEDLPFN